jgi:hypothetical protein
MSALIMLQLVSLIDWDKTLASPYVLLDPMSPNHSPKLLYLTEGQYAKMINICLSNDKRIVLIAAPGDDETSLKAKYTTPSNLTDEVVKQSRSPVTTKPENESSGEPRTPIADSKPKSENSPSKEEMSFFWSNRVSDLISPLYKMEGIKISKSMVEPTKGNLRRIYSVWGQALAGWIGIQCRDTLTIELSSFSTHLTVIIAKNGPRFLISYLKASFIAVVNYIGKIPLEHTRSLGVSVTLVNGLPRFLPLRWRTLIRAGHVPTMRLVLSLLASYKALHGKYKAPDYSTITAPPHLSEEKEFATFCHYLLQPFLGCFSTWDWSSTRGFRGAMSSGVNGAVSFLSRHLDFEAWHREGEDDATRSITSNAWSLVLEWIGFGLSRNERDMHYILQRVTHLCRPHPVSGTKSTCPYPIGPRRKPDVLRLGRLSLKYEAAGKIRVFAMVDSVTQFLLSPLHSALERVLRKFPQDATFDQEGKTAEYALQGYPRHWSFDLKSATDLIPQVLYLAVLRPFLGEDGAQAWLNLMVKRDFALPGSKSEDWSNPFLDGIGRAGHRVGVKQIPTLSSETVRYTRGQPMGAKSSWPAMALVHHCIVLYAAFLQGSNNPFAFRAYLVLGDDVVIGDEGVANKYLDICKAFGITVGLAKSFAGAKEVFQFANKVYFQGINISPLSLKQELSSGTPTGRANMALTVSDRYGKKYNNPVTDFLMNLFPYGSGKLDLQREFSRGSLGKVGSLALRTLTQPGSLLASRLGTGRALLLWLVSLSREVPIYALSLVAMNDIHDQIQHVGRFVSIPLIQELLKVTVTTSVESLLNGVLAAREALATACTSLQFEFSTDIERKIEEVSSMFWNVIHPLHQVLNEESTLLSSHGIGVGILDVLLDLVYPQSATSIAKALKERPNEDRFSPGAAPPKQRLFMTSSLAKALRELQILGLPIQKVQKSIAKTYRPALTRRSVRSGVPLKKKKF